MMRGNVDLWALPQACFRASNSPWSRFAFAAASPVASTEWFAGMNEWAQESYQVPSFGRMATRVRLLAYDSSCSREGGEPKPSTRITAAAKMG